MEKELQVAGVKKLRATGHDSWLEARRSFVGGSDIAAIMSVSPWRTPFTVWCEKLGVSANKDTASMRYGRNNESRLLNELQEELGEAWVLYRSPVTYMRGRLGANLDGLAVADGKTLGVEIKTTRDAVAWSQVPLYYFLQVQHYMLVCNLEMFVVYAQGRGWRKHFFIEASDETHALILKEVERFWAYVEKKEPPCMPCADDKREVDYMVLAARAGLLRAMEDGDFEDACALHLNAQKALKAAELAATAAKVNLIAGMGMNKEKTTNRWRVHLKEIKGECLDSVRFKADYPELYAQYLIKSSYAQLSVKEISC